ncbi:MAG: glutathione peroxidase [Xanthomarina sp.]|nr:glutathione peroxidase [Xanthomarina sp.]HAB28731.1 glutathione peroxidase [Xanthomarina gelatinilytica]HAI17942.1 glutathione peroxidase [Xanthomarina gelatinilytica]|tara:strand:- start:59 stop:607 length:549 start_codon:yes stop_codon:yes gene_type:complete
MYKIVLIMISLIFFNNLKTNKSMQASASLYDISINSLTGEPIDLSSFKGKKILIVNTASECGFTGQYEGLQELYNTYKDKLVVIGVPCNQFGGQEPGTASEIQSFCKQNYGVTFLMTEKVDVKGGNQHPLYKWLTSKELNGVSSSSVKWNFQKYLINEKGNLIDYYYSITSPTSTKITKHLK